jgi:hypothetical protein
MASALKVILPTAYFPPIAYFSHLLQNRIVVIEQMETYPKQTFRNRCEIMTSAGKLDLIVPVSKPNGNHTLTRDIEISYKEPWNQHHWKFILTAYRSSPYFNYYSDILEPLFKSAEPSLINHNYQTLGVICKILGIKPEIIFTQDYIKQPEDCLDLRRKMTPKKINADVHFPEYPQVFSHIHGFKGNLSILDLIFNTGPEAKSCLLLTADDHL